MSPSPTVVQVTDPQGSPSASTAPDMGPSIPPTAGVTTSIFITNPSDQPPPTVVLVTAILSTSPKPSSPFPSTSSLHTSPSPSAHPGSSHHVNIGAAIGGAFAGFTILTTIILVIFYLRKRNRSTKVYGAITQFDSDSRRNGAGNYSRSNNHRFEPLLEANDEQVSPTLRANGLDHIHRTLPDIATVTHPTAPPPDIPRPQTIKEEAQLIRRLYGHIPTEEIVLIVDGLRAERERPNRDPVDVTPEMSRQLRGSVHRNPRRGEEQNAAGDIDLDSSSVAQVTPPPSMNQDAPPPRYSRLIGDDT